MSATISPATPAAPAASAAPAAPVVQGLFTGQGDATRLLASRCRGCGSVYFPRSLSCRHPRCTDKQVEPLELGPQGTLYSYTVQAYKPPPLFEMDDWAPYALGLVAFPEGLRVLAMLTGLPPSDWRIGMPVHLTTEALRRDAQGQPVLTYKFRPLAEEGGRA